MSLWWRGIDFACRFYLGRGAPMEQRSYPECLVRAAQDSAPELVRSLLAVYLGNSEGGTAERIKPSCCRVVLAGGEKAFFVKEFPSRELHHDLERWVRLSRAERAWRAAHLLPPLGIATPRAIGTAQARAEDGRITEYLVTEWLEGARQFPKTLEAAVDFEERVTRLREMAEMMSRCHSRGVYTRDFVKNVLVVEGGGARRYWLCDLDGIHPYRRVTEKRVLFHLRQLAHYTRPTVAEARLTCEAYLGTTEGAWAGRVIEALMT